MGERKEKKTVKDKKELRMHLMLCRDYKEKSRPTPLPQFPYPKKGWNVTFHSNKPEGLDSQASSDSKGPWRLDSVGVPRATEARPPGPEWGERRGERVHESQAPTI